MQKDVISPDELVEALAEATRTMTEEVVEEVENGLERIAKETVEEIKRLSPVYKGNSKKLKKGDYRKKWKFMIDKERGVTKVTIYNQKGALTHLLEHGHLVKNGTGRVLGNADPIPHIEIAEKHAEEKIDRLMEGL
ncbi:MAG: HK97 gp10 family phage protein [Ruminococcus sp.]|uniref:HK97 gp10 family phage protein n=1 Tax=Ruminococcus sp. TaxID=41978 RepID=UPI0025FFD906|nr:HK97 gp10 family phage protein [Ruminococcus sp.]MCR4794257.1 HK97 gp10 family phage protein [Ruminococcus sp.]